MPGRIGRLKQVYSALPPEKQNAEYMLERVIESEQTIPFDWQYHDLLLEFACMIERGEY